MAVHLDYLFSNFILVLSMIIAWNKLLNKKMDYKNPRLYISIILIIATSLMNYFLIPNFVKIILLTILFMFFFKFLYKEKNQVCVITPIFSQIIIMISETLYVLILTTVFGFTAQELIKYFSMTTISNIAIALIMIFIVHLKFVRKLYNSLVKLISKIKFFQNFIYCLIALIALGVFPVTIYYKIDFAYLLLFYSAMILIFCFMIIYSFKTQNKYNNVSDKYNIAINSLKDYEDMMTKYRIANHENKNLLLTIRAMILNNEDDIPKYIDSIVEEKYKDDEKLLFKMSVIPSGGLRATIYSEILKIKNNNIKYSLNIDNKLSTLDLIELDKDTIIDACKIIGVFIDNAIEEVKKLRIKNIEINLFLEDNNLNIKVSNQCKTVVDIDKIFDKGYTTKGKEHGYGLSLVKNIISNNQLLESKCEINKKLFSQTLIIKYKNKKSL